MKPETNDDGMPDFQRRPGGLVRGEEGQITVIFALLAMALVFFWMSVYQTGECVNEKIKVQDVADACSYSGAVWGARMLNLIAYTNRAIIANMVTMTEIVIARSHSKFWLDVAVILELITVALSWIPILGPILEIVGKALAILATVYESVTWAIGLAAFRVPSKKYAPFACGWWFCFLHNLCALENSAHFMLAPPPYKGVYADSGNISSKLDTALIPLAIKHTNELIDPPGNAGGEFARIYVNPAMTGNNLPAQVKAMSFVFRQWTLQSFNDLLTWPGGKHGIQKGPRKGEYDFAAKRVFGTKSSFNKLIDQKYRLKWAIEENAKKNLKGLWSWDRGSASSGGLMDAISTMTSLWFVGIDIGGTTHVDTFYDGPIQVVSFLGGKVFVRAGGPDRLQNDHDVEATDYLRVWYRQFWKLFSFPKKTLFQAGEIALLSEDTDPAFGEISPTVGSYYSDRADFDDEKETGYLGLPHEDNDNHYLQTFYTWSSFYPVPNELPAPQFFLTLGFDPQKSKKEKTIWTPTGIHELNNDMFMQGNNNRGDRAIWKSGGNPGSRGLAWMSSNLPSYCYVIDAKARLSGGGGGGSGKKFYVPKEKDRNKDNEQFGKRCGVVLAVGYKDARGLNIVEIMGQNSDGANPPTDAEVTLEETVQKESYRRKAQGLTNNNVQYENDKAKVKLDMIRSGKFMGIGMAGFTAWSAAEVYFERQDNPEEPPNEFNPCWRARLAPFDRHFQSMLEGGSTPALKQIATLMKKAVDASLKPMQQIWKALGGSQDDIDVTTLVPH